MTELKVPAIHIDHHIVSICMWPGCKDEEPVFSRVWTLDGGEDTALLIVCEQHMDTPIDYDVWFTFEMMPRLTAPNCICGARDGRACHTVTDAGLGLDGHAHAVNCPADPRNALNPHSIPFLTDADREAINVSRRRV